MQIYGDFEGFPLFLAFCLGWKFLNDPCILKKLAFKTLAAHVDRVRVLQTLHMGNDWITLYNPVFLCSFNTTSKHHYFTHLVN